MKIYESLLKLSSEQLESQLEKIKKGESELDENDMDVDIQINSKSEKDLNDTVLLNIFLLLKKIFGIVFNDSIHNKTDIGKGKLFVNDLYILIIWISNLILSTQL